MKVMLQILALIALIIGAMFLFAVAKMFTPKHSNTSSNASSTLGSIGIVDNTGVGNKTASSTATVNATSINMSDMIQVNLPKPNTTVSSPLKVSGQARGNWYFEASFPVTVVDWDGKIIGQGPVQANPPAGGDWMTTDFVPFEGTINFTKPECAAGADYCRHGSVIFKNDNPSGQASTSHALEIPVTFE